ncbi:MAG: DUF4405 domain-containing protein [Endomicrobiales bacterium]
MDKIHFLRLTNAVLLIVIVIQAITGLVLFFQLVFPGAPLVVAIHRYNALLLIVLVAVHLLLNWAWVRVNLFARR